MHKLKFNLNEVVKCSTQVLSDLRKYKRKYNYGKENINIISAILTIKIKYNSTRKCYEERRPLVKTLKFGEKLVKCVRRHSEMIIVQMFNYRKLRFTEIFCTKN